MVVIDCEYGYLVCGYEVVSRSSGIEVMGKGAGYQLLDLEV